jgi:non-specific serine/threonine protein kinase
MADIPGRTLMIGIIAFLLGIVWVIFKSLHWAAGTPEARFEKSDTSRLADIKPEKSIVVLPFKNISPEEGQDYFSEGLTEELITMLSKVLSLRVISRTSAFMFKDTPKSVGMIAQELNVGYVLEGSVRKAGNKLRISAQLIDAMADAHIWADNYDGNLDYIFDIQENVARAIVDKLQLKLTAPEERQIAKRPIADRQAHEFYLRARDAMYRTFTAESIDEAIRFLEAGLGITGDNARLLATLANVYLQAVRVWIKEEADLVKAEEYAQKALRLDPGMASAYIALGYIQWLRGNPRESFRLVKQALWLDPNDVDTVVWAFWLFITAGKTATALDVAKHIAELDPVHPFLFFYPSVIHAYEGRFDTAIDELKRLIPPVFLEQPNNLGWLGWWLLLAGRLDEAKAALEPYEKVAAPGLQLWLPRILWLALSGQRHRLDEETSGKSGERAKHDSLISSIVADLYVMLGDHQKAVTWLEAAVDHGFINYPYISQYDPMLARLRNEPPFQKLMERVKYEWEHFEE